MNNQQLSASLERAWETERENKETEALFEGSKDVEERTDDELEDDMLEKLDDMSKDDMRELLYSFALDETISLDVRRKTFGLD